MKLNLNIAANASNIDFQRIGSLAIRQLILQISLIAIAVVVAFPAVWIIAMATDARSLPQYTEIVIIPETISTTAFSKLLFEPFPTNSLPFWRMLANSLFVALGTALLAVVLGASAAYAFSRFKFIGRKFGLLGFILLLMMPATGTLVPLIAIFSLVRVHVFFGTFAPALFFGFMAALATFGVNAAWRNALSRSVLKNNVPLQASALVAVIMFVFGLQLGGWGIMFYNSDAYDTSIRQPLTATNEIRDEVQAITIQIPRREANIDRQRNFLIDAEAEYANFANFQDTVNEEFSGATAFITGAGGVTQQIATSTSFGSASIATVPTNVADPLAVRERSLLAELRDQEREVIETEFEVEQLQVDLENTQQAYDEAQQPFLDLRTDAMVAIAFPYVAGTTLFSIVIAGGLWFAFRTVNKDQIAVIRRDRFQFVSLIGYVLIVGLVTYAWFDKYYESPTAEAGLEDGGLLYDIRLTFTDEDALFEELEPFRQRAALEGDVVRIEEEGLDAYTDNLGNRQQVVESAITRMEAINAELRPEPTVLGLLELQEIETVYAETAEFVPTSDQFATATEEVLLRDYLPVLQAREDELRDELILLSFDGMLRTDGVSGIDVEALQSAFLTVQNGVERLTEVQLALDERSAFTRSETIDWQEVQRDVVRDEFEVIRGEVRSAFPDGGTYEDEVGDSNRLNRLNNENFKDQYLSLLRGYEVEVALRLELADESAALTAETGDAAEAGVVLTPFTTLISTLPDDQGEFDRLEREFFVRNSSNQNVTEQLKITLFGLMIAYSSSALPFAIWNLKGYFDTIPKELEEAALVDGANLFTTFVRVILPLALPALAITTLFGFMTGWTEFILATQFLSGASDASDTTLAIALRGIAGGGETQADPDYSQFAAMSILMSIPVMTLFYLFQRWIVSGLTVGGVKG
jgi:ABC-type maltose transport system permease subunit/cbb3-type cytochrome oxidase subunit 3